MRRFLVTALASIAGACFALASTSPVDSTAFKALSDKLDEYFVTLDGENLDVKAGECDFLIETTKDSVLRQFVALKIYDHYLNSPVMGDEAVSIHLTDNWFAPGKVKMKNDADLMNAKVFADFNRQSLLGLQAPPLTLLTPEGESFEVRSRRYSVLFFFDTDCSKCKVETILLRLLLEREDYPIDFFAIYTGLDEDSWKTWREEKFNPKVSDTRVVHLWDPAILSDYQVKYGVLSTPRMFLVDPRGRIVGRGMDHNALRQLLDIFLSVSEYEYGGEDTKALLDGLFRSYGDTLEVKDVLATAELLESRTLAKGDTVFYKHLEGDMLYYLSNQRGEVFKNASLDFVDKFILSRPEIWNTADDSLKVVGLAGMMKGLLSKTPVGSRLPSLKINGKDIRRVGGKGAYIVFYSGSCEVCQAELAAIDSSRRTSGKGRRFLMVDTDEVMDEDMDLFTRLLDTFDLSVMPFIIEVDKKGYVKRKYVSFLDARQRLD